jgi:hypothetical protein
MYFVFCRLYPFVAGAELRPLPILMMGEVRRAQKEDDCGPLSIQSSLNRYSTVKINRRRFSHEFYDFGGIIYSACHL